MYSASSLIRKNVKASKPSVSSAMSRALRRPPGGGQIRRTEGEGPCCAMNMPCLFLHGDPSGLVINRGFSSGLPVYPMTEMKEFTIIELLNDLALEKGCNEVET